LTIPEDGIIPEHVALHVEYQDLKNRETGALDLPFEWR
jgi:hypothetical protein